MPITNNVATIRTAIYGEEVREAIASGLEECWNHTAAEYIKDVVPEFKTNVSYSAGDYVYYGTDIYKFTTAHSAGAWTGNDASIVMLSDDLAQFTKSWTIDEKRIDSLEVGSKNYFYDRFDSEHRIDFLSSVVWSTNRIDDNTGADVNDGNWCRSDNFIELSDSIVTRGAIDYAIHENTLNLAIAIYMYDKDKNYLGYYFTYSHPEETVGNLFITESQTKYIRILIFNNRLTVFDDIPTVLSKIGITALLSNKDSQLFGADNFELGYSLNDNPGYPYPCAKKIGFSARALSGYIPVGKGSIFDMAYNTRNDTESDVYYYHDMLIVFYDKNFGYISSESMADYARMWTCPRDGYIRIILRYKKDNSYAITLNDVNDCLNRLSVYYVKPALETEYIWNRATYVPDDSLYYKGISLHDIPQFWNTDSANEWEFRNPARVTVDYFPVGAGTIIKMSTERINESDVSTKEYSCFYDKNFLPITSDYNWECETVVKQDCYVRIVLRRTTSNSLTDADVAQIKDWLTIDYVAPSDPCYLEPIEINEKNGIRNGMSILYGDRLSTVRQNMLKHSEPGRLGYLWISDLHITTDQRYMAYNRFVIKRILSAVSEIANSADLDFVCIGGDVFEAELSTDNVYNLISECMEPLKDCKVPIIWLFGNHDNNVYGGDWHTHLYMIPWDESMALFPHRSNFYNDIVLPDMHDGYFYFDIPSKKKRVICLNGNDPEESGTTATWWSLNRSQLEWMCTDATDTENDIVVLTHTNPGFEYGYYGHGDEGGYYTDLANVISAYNSRSSITLYGQTYDFSSSQGHVVCIHCGHTHFDLDPIHEDYKWGGVPVIVTSCAKAWSQYVNSNYTEVDPGSDLYILSEHSYQAEGANTYGYEFYLWTHRNFATLNESLFDVVSINSDKVYTFRVGAGLDREYDLT